MANFFNQAIEHIGEPSYMLASQAYVDAKFEELKQQIAKALNITL
jgi:hypothetical protein